MLNQASNHLVYRKVIFHVINKWYEVLRVKLVLYEMSRKSLLTQLIMLWATCKLGRRQLGQTSQCLFYKDLITAQDKYCLLKKLLLPH